MPGIHIGEHLPRMSRWLHKIAPGSYPTYFGLFAWASARLFTEEAIKLGGQLDRQTLLASLKEVKDWTGHGLFAPQNVGERKTGGCSAIIRLENGPVSLFLINAGAAAVLMEARVAYISVSAPVETLNELRGRALFASYTLQEDSPRAFRFIDPFGVSWQIVAA